MRDIERCWAAYQRCWPIAAIDLVRLPHKRCESLVRRMIQRGYREDPMSLVYLVPGPARLVNVSA